MTSPEQRSYKRTVLHGTDAFEIVACEWNRTSVSALHDHGWSLCSVLVQEGRFENRLELGLRNEIQVVEAGGIIATPMGAEHEIRCLSDFGKTLHVYMPRIKAGENALSFSTPSIGELRERLDLKISADGTNWAQIESLLKSISSSSISTHSPYFMNQLFSGVFPETLAAEQVTAQARTTMATFEASPVFTTIELEVVDRLGELIGWHETQRDGIGVPGGSAANIMAVHCARQKLMPDFRRRGSNGEKFKVFVSKAAHYSLTKACLATGIGTDALVSIETDRGGRMMTAQLNEKINEAKARGEIPLLVAATAGTTVSGAFDSIDEIAKICKSHSIWLHVDAAWGGPALFSKANRSLFSGVDQADSLTFDAHKLFGSGLTCSFFLNRHRGLLLQANDAGGSDYLFHSAANSEAPKDLTLDRGRLSWQCGRGPDVLSFWTLWKSTGTSGLGQFVDRLFSVRDDAVRWIKDQPRLKLVSEPSYLNICVRIESADVEASRKAREAMKNKNFAFVNFSSDDDGPFLRLILAHPKIDLTTVQSILTEALEKS